MIDYTQLKIKELREYAKSIGISPQQHESKESLSYRISLVAFPETQQQPKQPVKKEPEIIVFSTAEQVKAKISNLIDKGLIATFDEDSWRFQYKGREDSGSLSMPMSVIVRKAGDVAKGALMPRIIRNTGTDMDGAIA